MRRKINAKSRLIDMWLTIVITLTVVYYVHGGDIDAQQDSQPIKVCFTPGGKCDDLLVSYIESANKSIYMHSYSFTSAKIADALTIKHKMGVKISILYDNSSSKSKYSQIKNLKSHGIQVTRDKVPGLAHNKIMIIDGEVVVTGSYNWSNAAQKRNSENLLFLHGKSIASKYQENWNTRFNTSVNKAAS